jgi:hypothetical protein
MTWYPNSEGRHGASGAKGDAGEAMVKSYFEEMGIEAEHKTDYESQVIKKIDFIIKDTGQKMDVKTNYYMGNLAVELYVKSRDRRGWLYTSEADIIYGVDLEGGQIFEYSVEEMRAFVRENIQKAKLTKYKDVIMWVNVNEKLIRKIK